MREERGKVALYRFPKHPDIDAEVFVDEDIANPTHFAPGEIEGRIP